MLFRSQQQQQQQQQQQEQQSSRAATRPVTPFNQSLSVPATPPEFFLVTRSSPSISQSLWENFQPNQLFPDDTGLPYFSPPPPANALDPQLQQQQQGMVGGGSEMGLGGGDGQSMQPGMMHHHHGSPGIPVKQPWLGSDMYGITVQDVAGLAPGSSPEDTWSNSSTGAGVPATLNVEDWYCPFLYNLLGGSGS